jgi:uncharacterized protein YraI
MFSWVKEARVESIGDDRDLDDFHEFGMDVFPMRPTRKVRLPWLKFLAGLAVLAALSMGAVGYLTGAWGNMPELQPVLVTGAADDEVPPPAPVQPTAPPADYGEEGEDEDGENGEGEQSNVRVAFAATGANMRANSTENSQVIAVLPAGSEAEVTGDPVNGWVPINFGGQAGWVWGSLVQLRYGSAPAGGGAAGEATEPEGPEFDPDFETSIAHIRNSTNLRPAPSISNQPLRVVARGAEITVIGPVAGGWVPIEYQGTRGYVAAQNVDLTPPG